MIKIVLQGKEAREKLKKGVDVCVNMVGATMGPWGRNIAIEWVNRWPYFVDDGVTVARKLEVDDETENLGLLALVNAATRTDDDAGDGTTAAVVLGGAIINEVFKKVDDDEGVVGGARYNVVQAYKDINHWAKIVLEEIDKVKKPITKKEELERVAVISAKDEELGKVIAEMMWKLGKYGFIKVEDSFIRGVHHEIVEGLHFNGRHVADFMANAKKEVEAVDVPVIVTNYKIQNLSQFLRTAGKPRDFIFEDLNKQGKTEIVIISPEFSNETIVQFWQNQRSGYKFIAISAKSLTNEQMEDVAVYTGASFIDMNKGYKLNQIAPEDLGKARKFLSAREKVSISGGGAAKEIVEKRVEALRDQLAKEDDDLFRKKLERRISALSGGVGLISIGSESDIRKNYLIKKAEDAKNSARAALEDGIIRGGGLVLKEIAERLPENILTKPLKVPYETIQENAGGHLEIAEDVFDAASVIKTAIKNACSVASVFIMTGGSIATKRKNLMDDLMAQIKEDERFQQKLPPKDQEKETDAWRENAGEF